MELPHRNGASVFALAERFSEIPAEFVKNLQTLDGPSPPNFYDGILSQIIKIINDPSRAGIISTLAEKNTDIRERNATTSLISALSADLHIFRGRHLSSIPDLKFDIPESFPVKIPRIYRDDMNDGDIFCFNLIETDLGSYKRKIINSLFYRSILHTKPDLLQSRKFSVSAPLIDASIKKRKFRMEEISRDNIFNDTEFDRFVEYIRDQWKIYQNSPRRMSRNKRDPDLFS